MDLEKIKKLILSDLEDDNYLGLEYWKKCYPKHWVTELRIFLWGYPGKYNKYFYGYTLKTKWR